MPYKVVALNHQTFLSSSDASTSNTFRFTRVYKTNPKQKFLLKPISLAWYHDTDKQNPEPHLFFVRGLPKTNGELVVQSTENLTDSSAQENKNKTLLGVLGGGVVSYSSGTIIRQGHTNQIVPPEFMFDEIPLDDFKIECLHLDESIADESSFLVSFQIETIEEY
jgi:hypothetical protein